MKKRENMCWITVASIIMTIGEFIIIGIVMAKFLSQVILRMMIYECVDQGFTVNHSLVSTDCVAVTAVYDVTLRLTSTVLTEYQWGRRKIRYKIRYKNVCWTNGERKYVNPWTAQINQCFRCELKKCQKQHHRHFSSPTPPSLGRIETKTISQKWAYKKICPTKIPEVLVVP